jgi:HlyD family secretion protein
MKKIIRIVLLLAVAGGAAYWYWQSRENDNRDHIVVSGNIELTQVDLSFKVPGRLVELNVREGDWVKKGAVIAKLDSAQLSQQRSRDEASVAAAQSNYKQLETSIEYQQSTLEGEIAQRKAEVAQAEARLEELLAGSRQQEIAQARSAVTDAKAWYDVAKTEWERAQTLYKNEDISRQQFDQARTKFESQAALLGQAEQKLALVLEGPRKEEIASARAQLARAQAALSTAEANRIEIRRKREELGARQAEIAKNRAQVGITDAQIADTTIVAPIDGVVLVKAAEAGEIVAAGTAIVSIGDLDHPWLRAYVPQPYLGRFDFGDKVKLSTDSFKDKVYEGRISFIAQDAEFTPKQIQTKEERIKMVYRIKVDVDNSSHELKGNMPVDAEIRLKQARS